LIKLDTEIKSQFIIDSTRVIPSLEGRINGTFLTNKKIMFSIYSALLVISEFVTVLEPIYGLLLHSLTLVILCFHAPLIRRLSPKSSKLAICLIPIPLIRIVSITSPLIEFTLLEWFLVISMILFSSIIASMVFLGDDLESYGFVLPQRRHFWLELGVVFLGLIFGYMEYQILKPNNMVNDLTVPGLAAPLVALYFGTGLLEELLFRGIIQKHAIDAFNKWYGVLFTTLIFMIMHTGWESFLDVIFVGAVGFFFSLVVLKTGSLIGVSFSHAITNLSLFVLTPSLFS